MDGEKRKYYFVSGLPRAGSTLLCNVLAQNPRFEVTGTSGIINVIMNIRNTWDDWLEFKTLSEKTAEAAKKRVMRAVLDAYFADAERPIVFDKSRGWLAWLEVLEAILGEKPKVIVPVRDIRDIMASFEKLYRKTAGLRQLSQERAPAGKPFDMENFFQMRTIQGRCQALARQDGIVGNAVINLRDALYRGWKDQLFLVDYDLFTKQPKKTMRDIYDFLGEEYCEKHDYENVEQVTQEDDLVWIWKDLHKIRPKIEAQPPQWKEILPKALAQQYTSVDARTGAKDCRFWEDVVKELEKKDD